MTDAQIKKAQLEETKRANEQREAETKRSNEAREKLERRSQNLGILKTPLSAISNIASGFVKGAALNDPEWYDYNPELTESAAGYSIQILGNKMNGIGDHHHSIPGIMIMDVALTPGVAKDPTSPVNRAAVSIFNYIRRSKSGGNTYEPMDVMLYLLALANAYAFHGEMVRLYGALNYKVAQNKYSGPALVEALGYDFGDLQGRQADLRTLINLFRVNLSAFKAPPNMNYFKKAYSMFLNVMTDSDEYYMDQMYAYRPALYYTYDESAIGQLTPHRINSSISNSLRNFEDLRVLANTFINSITLSSDIGTMNSDLNAAFENGYELPILEAEYVTIPKYSPLELAQWANTTIPVAFSSNTSSWVNMNITQDVDRTCLKFQPSMGPRTSDSAYPMLTAAVKYLSGDQLVRFYGLKPSGSEYLELIANMSGFEEYTSSSTSNPGIILVWGGLVLADGISIFNLNNNYAIEGRYTQPYKLSYQDGLGGNDLLLQSVFYYTPINRSYVVGGNENFPWVFGGPRSRDGELSVTAAENASQVIMSSLWGVPFRN